MITDYVINWSIVAALFATTAAIFATGVTYFSAKSRNDLEARIEICKYREKWLSEFKEEVVTFISHAMLLGVEDKKDKLLVRGQITRNSRILIAVPTSNLHYEKLAECLGEITQQMMENKSPLLGGNTGTLMRISKEIVQDEWEEIKSLLHKERL